MIGAVACRSQATSKQKPEKTSQTATADQKTSATAAAMAGNPLAPYIHRSIVDEFNPDVADAERRQPRPRRGGTLVVRMSGDVSTVNPLLQTWLQDQVVISYITDWPESLVHRDPETLEYMPKMAEYWKVRDIVEKRDGTRIEGLITTETARSVTIAKGTSLWTFLRSDIVSSDTKTGLVTTRFGQKMQGQLTLFDLTMAVKETSETAPLTLAKEELSTWTNEVGTKLEVRPFIKRRCIYEFRLRPAIQWHDGRPVTMDDARCWFDTLRNPRVDCAPLRLYYLDVEKMEVLDPMTAKFTYRKPYFLALDFLGGIGFLPRHILQPDRFRDDPEGYAKFFNEHPMGQPGKGQFVGMGPYRLDHWMAGQEIVLVRNDNYWACKANLPYWDRERPYLDKIVFRIIQEKIPALRELENGNVDADFDVEPDTWILPQTNAPQFTSRYVRAKFTTPGYTYVGWNEERNLFKDAQVRRALTLLVPREQILKQFHYGLGTVVAGPFFIENPCADRSVKPLPYDPAEARRLLRRAGWIDHDGDGILDKDGKKFEFEYLIHTARAYHAQIADIIKQNLGQAGIQVNIRKIDSTVFGKTVADHNFDAVRFAWTDTIDGDPYQIWHSSQSKDRGSNYISYANPRVDELIEKGREEFDPIKRWEMFREVYRIICEDQPFTFLFNFDNLTFYHKKFHGVKFYLPIPGYDYTEWYIAGEK
jgi:peptide/nickel transport system substrate-binding protein